MAIGTTTLVLAGTAAVGAAVAAGVFFGFSTLVLPALDKVAQPDAIGAMQEVNRIAVRSALMPLMFGTAGIALAAAVTGLSAGRTVALLGLTGAALYLIGVIGVTIAANVPLNDSLAQLSSAAAEPGTWQAYSDPWTFWNSVRAATGTAASGCFAAMLYLLGKGAA